MMHSPSPLALRQTLLGAIALLAAALPAPGTTILHAFSGSGGDGKAPAAPLLYVGGKLLGTTTNGGVGTNSGTVFTINPDGTGYSIVHNFASSGSEGTGTEGLLALSGSTIYGTNPFGPNNFNSGTVWKMDVSGSGFAVLHTFTSLDANGYDPTGGVTLGGSTLYGTTYNGGNGSFLYKVGIDGTGFTKMFSLSSGVAGHLTLVGTTLYGTTYNAGTSNAGTLFKIGIDGTGYTVLHNFLGTAAADGSSPRGELTLVGSTFYGATGGGGTDNQGTIFKINTDGTGYGVVRQFLSGAGQANQPQGGLLQAGSVFFGSSYGGQYSVGTVFQMNLDGTGFSILNDFKGQPTDGSGPLGNLVEINSKLYGVTATGGPSLNPGTVFSAPAPEPGTVALGLLAGALLSQGRPRPGRRNGTVG